MKSARTKFSPTASLLIGCALALSALPSMAASTWTNMGTTQTSPAGNGCTNPGTAQGNSTSCGIGAGGTIAMSADAFSTTTTGNTAGTVFATAAVRQYSSGLGVVNAYEGDTDGPHSVDNQLGTDTIRLAFSSAINLTSFTIGWNGSDNYSADSDISVLAWTGSGSPGQIVGKTLTGTAASSTLLTEGWTLVGNYADVGTLAGNTASVSSTIFSSYWLISAYDTTFAAAGNSSGVGVLGTGKLDYFKLLGVAGNAPSSGGKVPEPGSLALMGIALTGMVVIRRRKGSAL